ncbi:MAG TPA: phospholipid carrier-dependent glycosyltransferase, partial [Desulfobacterales bacterium]|nr:phospholipid carrier-dependent glycosyltransferase [Desulfobacterales bacterium]
RVHITLPLTLYTFLALYGMWRYVTEPELEPERKKWVWKVALMIGCAMGTKYPAFLFAWVPGVAFILVHGLLMKRPLALTARRLCVIVFVPLILVSPWLIKNAVYTGNPVYPLLGKLFDGPEWDAEREAKFLKAHRAPPVGPLKAVRTCLRQVFRGKGASGLFIIFLLPLFWSRKPRSVLYLLGFICIFLFFWVYFTHHIERFLVPLIPCICLLAGEGYAACFKEKRCAVLASILVWILVGVHTFQAVLLQTAAGDLRLALSGDAEGYLKKQLGPAIAPILYLNELNRESRGPGQFKVLFLGEARTFYCSDNYFVAATVFDKHWLDRAMDGAVGGGVGSLDREVVERMEAEL